MPKPEKKPNLIIPWIIFTGLGLFLVHHGWVILKSSTGSVDELGGVVCVMIGFALAWIGNTAIIG